MPGGKDLYKEKKRIEKKIGDVESPGYRRRVPSETLTPSKSEQEMSSSLLSSSMLSSMLSSLASLN